MARTFDLVSTMEKQQAANGDLVQCPTRKNHRTPDGKLMSHEEAQHHRETGCCLRRITETARALHSISHTLDTLVEARASMLACTNTMSLCRATAPIQRQTIEDSYRLWRSRVTNTYGYSTCWKFYRPTLLIQLLAEECNHHTPTTSSTQLSPSQGCSDKLAQ